MVQLESDLQSILRDRLGVTTEAIAEFCQGWKIVEFGLFGSVLRDDFGANSDVDILVTYTPGHRYRWRDWLAARDELEGMFGRSVDVVEKDLLQNPYRRAEVLQTYRVIYSYASSCKFLGSRDVFQHV